MVIQLKFQSDNLTDYIFYPDLIGLDFDATLEQIADKIIADRKWTCRFEILTE